MHIGIWCDYGFTLEPSEGIGVFVDNLARGLVRAEPNCEILLMAHPGQEAALESTVAGGLGRISVTSGIKLSRSRRRVIRTLKRFRRRLGEPSADRRLAFRVDQWVKSRVDALAAPAMIRSSQVIEACDLWLLPYVGLEQEFNRPTVVAIHDLVCYHFPEMMQPAKLAWLKRLVMRVSEKATIAACMSEFIRDHDLIGTLGLPEDRVRVIKAAVPDGFAQHHNPQDSAEIAAEGSAWLISQGIAGPYIFYPAAFRSYKNHRLLIDALGLLKSRSPLPWKVIFTGIQKCPSDLRARIAKLSLESDVLILKKVTRSELQHLYRNAFATIVPSLYEQGSFPIMEALNCRCPVAASDIPSLREQFGSMRDSMLFFDPRSPESLIPVVETIMADRQSIIDAQQFGFTALRTYTWTDSAQGWLKVFREAMELPYGIAEVRHQRKAA